MKEREREREREKERRGNKKKIKRHNCFSPSPHGLLPAIFRRTAADTFGAPKGVKSDGVIPHVRILNNSVDYREKQEFKKIKIE